MWEELFGSARPPYLLSLRLSSFIFPIFPSRPD